MPEKNTSEVLEELAAILAELVAILAVLLDVEDDAFAGTNRFMLRADFTHGLIKWGGLRGTARERREQARKLARIAVEAVKL